MTFRCLDIKTKNKGFTLIEVLIGSFLTLVIFLALFLSYQFSLKLVGFNKNKVTATAIAEGELERIRNLPYNSIGIKGGFPDGVLDSSKTEVLNGVVYTIQERVDYVIDPADGIASPEDDCPNDYKRVEVKVSWSGITKGETVLATDIAPENLAQECSDTGGILYVSVFDASGKMVSSPFIQVINPQTGEVIKTATPDSGKHYFSLAPGTYKIVVFKDGYTSEETYGIDEIANPEKPNPIILTGKLTEISFSIDKVSSFFVKTLSSQGLDNFSDSFSDQEKISAISNLILENGTVVLEDSSNSGLLISIPIEPEGLVKWQEFSFDDSQPTNTQITYQVLYYTDDQWKLIPDIDLPGNSFGFNSSPIDISNLDVSVYSKLKVKASFYTSDEGVSPKLYDWQVSWVNNQSMPIGDISFNLKGEKIIGTDTSDQPIYKFNQDFISDSDGEVNITNLEWDNYTFSLNPDSDLDLESTDPSPQPISLSPDTNLSVSLYISSQNSLLIKVEDADSGEPIFGANVRLYNSDLDYDKTQETDEKGQTYFIPLKEGNYSLDVQMVGYESKNQTVSVSGDKSAVILLTRTE